MDSRREALTAVDALHLHVAFDKTAHVGSLRYFESPSEFTTSIESTLMASLPRPLKATTTCAVANESLVALSWRSPTETTLVTVSESRFEMVKASCASMPDGCFVDQTHGLCVLRASGELLPELFSRLGGSGLAPQLGESKRSRLADVPVGAFKVQSKETLLVVERVYMEHLMDWISETAVDLDIRASVSP